MRHTCCMLLSSFPPLVRTLVLSLARVFPGIPLLLLSMVGLESWFRDKYIVYLSMLCFCFSSYLDVTLTVNELVGSNYSCFQREVKKMNLVTVLYGLH